MSKAINRIPLGQAESMAVKLADFLSDGCARVVIAGSVRRQAETVGDIEIVCQSKAFAKQRGMFGSTGDGVATVVDDMLVNRSALLAAGWELGKTNGPKHKKFIHAQKRTDADLYIVTDDRAWGSNLAVRTGPWYFSKAMMSRALKLGMVFQDGFFLHDHLRPCARGLDCPNLIEVPDERRLFKLLKIQWMEPPERDDGIRPLD